jgi:4-amino-4-deoxy-L-arabinose transferase-like glycosyltransferase
MCRKKQMRKTIERNPDVVILLIAGYFLLAMVVRLVRSSGLEVDETQQAFMSQFLVLGYGSQPPFYDWLQYGLNQAFGTSLATLTILKNTMLFFFCLFYTLAVRQLITSRSLCAIATLGTLTIPTVFLLVQRDLSHTVACLFAIALFLYGFFRTLRQPTLNTYLITGVAVGIGALSKYNFVVVPLAAVLAILPEKELRGRLLDWRILLSLALAALITTPHALWVVQNIVSATSQTVQEMKEGSDAPGIPNRLEGAIDLIISMVKGVLPTLAVFGLVFHKDLRTILRSGDTLSRVVGRMLALCFLVVLIVVVVVGATHMREKWLAPYIVLLPLYLCLKVQAARVDVKSRLPGMLAITAVLTIGTLLILLGRGLSGPLLGRYSLIHVPYAGFARAMEREGHAQPNYIVTDGGLLAGNLKVQFPSSTVYLTGQHPELLPKPWPADATVLVVSATKDGTFPANTQDNLKAMADWASLPAPTQFGRSEIPYPGSDGTQRHGFYYSWEKIGQQ